MGTKIVDECVGCAIPCINCGRKETPICYCDECEEEDAPIYEFDGEQLCEACILERLDDSILQCHECGATSAETSLYQDPDADPNTVSPICKDCIINRLKEAEPNPYD